MSEASRGTHCEESLQKEASEKATHTFIANEVKSISGKCGLTKTETVKCE